MNLKLKDDPVVCMKGSPKMTNCDSPVVCRSDLDFKGGKIECKTDTDHLNHKTFDLDNPSDSFDAR